MFPGPSSSKKSSGSRSGSRSPCANIGEEGSEFAKGPMKPEIWFQSGHQLVVSQRKRRTKSKKCGGAMLRKRHCGGDHVMAVSCVRRGRHVPRIKHDQNYRNDR